MMKLETMKIKYGIIHYHIVCDRIIADGGQMLESMTAVTHDGGHAVRTADADGGQAVTLTAVRTADAVRMSAVDAYCHILTETPVSDEWHMYAYAFARCVAVSVLKRIQFVTASKARQDYIGKAISGIYADDVSSHGFDVVHDAYVAILEWYENSGYDLTAVFDAMMPNTHKTWTANSKRDYIPYELRTVNVVKEIFKAVRRSLVGMPEIDTKHLYIDDVFSFDEYGESVTLSGYMRAPLYADADGGDAVESLEWLTDFIQTLTASEKAVLRHRIRGLSENEIADALHCTKNSVHGRLTRIRCKAVSYRMNVR